MQPTDEQWLPVKGYEGLYEVSNQGAVRCMNGDAVKLQHPHPHGYHRVNLKGRTHLVHALVLEAFVGPRPQGLVTRHLDGNPVNNNLGNLRYGTQSENVHDMRRHGTNFHVNKTHCPQGHPYDEFNTYVIPSRPSTRYCLICNRDRARAHYAKKKARRALAQTMEVQK